MLMNGKSYLITIIDRSINTKKMWTHPDMTEKLLTGKLNLNNTMTDKYVTRRAKRYELGGRRRNEK